MTTPLFAALSRLDALPGRSPAKARRLLILSRSLKSHADFSEKATESLRLRGSIELAELLVAMGRALEAQSAPENESEEGESRAGCGGLLRGVPSATRAKMRSRRRAGSLASRQKIIRVERLIEKEMARRGGA